MDNLNRRNKIDGLELMAGIKDASIAISFLDPQYKGILDKLKYGKHRMNGRYNLVQMDNETIKKFIEEIHRCLKKSGYLFLWLDKFHLIDKDDNYHGWIKDTDFSIVDLITWEKKKLGMGYRSRRKSEYLLVLQKAPCKAKSTWKDHSIPDVWYEEAGKEHPHEKPYELQKRLIAFTTNKGDIVLDPASGSYSVFKACMALDIDFIGGDIE